MDKIYSGAPHEALSSKDPLINSLSNNFLSIRIIDSSQFNLTKIWFVVTPTGKTSPLEILDLDTPGKAADFAANRGVNDHLPVMVSYQKHLTRQQVGGASELSNKNGADLVPISILLVPPPLVFESKGLSMWWKIFDKTISDWHITSLGLHFTTAALSNKQIHQLTLHTLAHLSKIGNLNQVFICANTENYTAMLNSCIEAKNTLNTEFDDTSSHSEMASPKGIYIIH